MSANRWTSTSLLKRSASLDYTGWSSMRHLLIPEMTENKFLRILIIEDSDDDAQLVLREIRRLGYDVDYQRIEAPEALRSALAAEPWDLVLCDYSLPHLNAP